MKSLFVSCLLLSFSTSLLAQDEFTLLEQTVNNPDNEPRPVFPVPNARQLRWNRMEFYAFFHYGMNTYTNKEWGYGNENPNLFAPTEVPDPAQWLEAIKAGGMRGGIAVVKHHDGFCLWPTQTTEHNVTRSNSLNAQRTNIPRDFAAAAHKLGLQYGFYVSPWDRNSRFYGDSTYVQNVFLKQCFELSQYGSDQFEMWFDGANGGDGYYGGANAKRSIDKTTYYDVPNLRDSVLKVCPNIVFWGIGDEARWIGNEKGYAGETNWAYGSGETGNENEWKWRAGESDAKATDRGWFWHPGEKVKSAETLFRMYLETVGRNANLILNFPPDRSGRLPQADVDELKRLGILLKERLGKDLARTASITASDTRAKGHRRNYVAANMNDKDSTTYWATNDDKKTAEIVLKWKKIQTVHYVALMEYIQLGQRIKAFSIETSLDGKNWTQRGGNVKTTTVGYKRIIPLNGQTGVYGDGFKVKYIRIRILDSKACPTLHTVSVF